MMIKVSILCVSLLKRKLLWQTYSTKSNRSKFNKNISIVWLAVEISINRCENQYRQTLTILSYTKNREKQNIWLKIKHGIALILTSWLNFISGISTASFGFAFLHLQYLTMATISFSSSACTKADNAMAASYNTFNIHRIHEQIFIFSQPLSPKNHYCLISSWNVYYCFYSQSLF